MNHFATTMLACGIMLAALPSARADTTCPPSPPLGTTINGNLIVPAGQNCTLVEVTVTGNVQVQTNATLTFPAPLPFGFETIVGNVSVGTGASVTVEAGLTIDGNLEANECRVVALGPGDIVGGNVQIQYCTEGGSLLQTTLAAMSLATILAHAM
jgi:hypothetical protein